MSIVREFIAERCSQRAGDQVRPSDLFDAWQAWLADRYPDYRGLGTLRAFCRRMHRDASTLMRRRILRDGKQRVRIYEGIGLK